MEEETEMEKVEEVEIVLLVERELRPTLLMISVTLRLANSSANEWWLLEEENRVLRLVDEE